MENIMEINILELLWVKKKKNSVALANFEEIFHRLSSAWRCGY